MAERIGKNDFAAFGNQSLSGIVAVVSVFGNVLFNNNLIVFQAEVCFYFVNSVDEVQVISGVFIMKKNETDLEVFRHGKLCTQCHVLKYRNLLTGLFIFLLARSKTKTQRSCHYHHEGKGQNFLEHFLFLRFLFFMLFYKGIWHP